MIRPLLHADIPPVLALLRSTFTHPWTEKLLDSELSMSNVTWIVAELHDGDSPETDRTEIPGPTVQMHISAEGPADCGGIVGVGSIWYLHVEAHITTLAVQPEWRRLNIGARLIEALMKRAGSTDAVKFILEVRESNAGALAFYSRFGFAEIGRRKGYYPAQEGNASEDAIVLSAPCGGGSSADVGLLTQDRGTGA